MAGFPASAAALGFAAALAFGAAWADDSPASAPPMPLSNTAPAAKPATPAQPADDETPPDSSIVVKPLGDIDGPAVGLLNDTNGGLGRHMWAGSEHGAIEDMLSRIPAGSNSPAVRDLARRLLLTTADSPIGEKHRSLLTIRLEELLDAGMVAEAGALASMTTLKDDPDFAQVQAEALLYAQRKEDLCGPLTAMRLTSAQPFWIELRAYCYAVNEDDPAYELTRAAMTAQSLDDKAFDMLLNDVIGGQSKNPGEIADPNPLDVFLMQQANVPVSGFLAVKLGIPADMFAMREARNPPDERLAVADRAMKAGAAATYDLIEVAKAQKFSADQLAHPTDAIAKMPFLQSEMLLYQAIAEAKDAATKARLLQAALMLGDKVGLLGVAAGMNADAIATLAPDGELHDMAPVMARAAMLTGKPDVAAGWIATLDPDADKAEVSVLTADLDLIATDPARDAKAQAALQWLAGQNDANAALVLGVYDAAGATVPPDAQSAAAGLMVQNWPGRRPAPAQLERLNAASGNPERSGEAVLTVLDIIGAKGPGDLAPDVTVSLLHALDHEGLSDVARRLGIEALLTYRVPQPAQAAAK